MNKSLKRALGVNALAQAAKKRLEGDYHVDEWGMDEGIRQSFWPILDFFYSRYFRVTVSGIENIPDQGRALLAANHGGAVPFDGAMVMAAIMREHPNPRLPKTLHVDMLSNWPWANYLVSRLGGVQAMPENAEKLLESDCLTLVFPEGGKGLGKPFAKRYQMQRFGRGGFVKVALKTQSPIIPVSIVGAEEIYPMLYDVKPLAKMLGLPWAPITFTWPWLGPLGALPLPSKWFIDFGKPIPIPDMKYRPSEEPLLVSRITAQVRDHIQKTVNRLLVQREKVFF
ncbi:phospholipid/glycerol acyltransferase [Desulfatibacillum aliphaticivorans]|uniref:Phospholipid/glycerol acyltransferase n=1 Tax=Desulfatibacillum aliphaticivorans TaxID=218208 RepID=B8FA96_DESAL|nr:lysophospholipid acyltransferase family protein [Desulfatibacillum aliphaticivorans]ACL03192.1 phospholipid/glycerol acyltransferase [Desulfatibacillum aliphaticivorans]